MGTSIEPGHRLHHQNCAGPLEMCECSGSESSQSGMWAVRVCYCVYLCGGPAVLQGQAVFEQCVRKHGIGKVALML